MILYWGSGSMYAWRVMLALLLKDLSYESHQLSFSQREHKDVAYTALNPRGKVPTLVDGDLVVTESIAILAYLDRAYPRTPLLGNSPAEGARIWREVMELENYLVRAADPLLRALFFRRWSRQVPALKAEVVKVMTELDRVERSAVEIGAFNAVDCLLVPLVLSLERAKLKAGASEVGLRSFDRQRWPKLAARLSAVETMEGFAETFPPHWR